MFPWALPQLLSATSENGHFELCVHRVVGTNILNSQRNQGNFLYDRSRIEPVILKLVLLNIRALNAWAQKAFRQEFYPGFAQEWLQIPPKNSLRTEFMYFSTASFRIFQGVLAGISSKVSPENSPHMLPKISTGQPSINLGIPPKIIRLLQGFSRNSFKACIREYSTDTLWDSSRTFSKALHI